MLENVFIALYTNGSVGILLDCSKEKREKRRKMGIKLKEVHLTIQEQGFLSTLSDSSKFFDMLGKFIIRGVELGEEK